MERQAQKLKGLPESLPAIKYGSRIESQQFGSRVWDLKSSQSSLSMFQVGNTGQDS
jgi:hypothetical protein